MTSEEIEIEEARTFLEMAGIFYTTRVQLEEARNDPECSEFIQDMESEIQVINLNDTWAWACADCVKPEDSELPEVARLYREYGWCGILYWAAEKQDIKRSEFEDTTRKLEFVRHEEAIRKEFENETTSSKLAYAKRIYTLGE